MERDNTNGLIGVLIWIVAVVVLIWNGLELAPFSTAHSGIAMEALG